MEHWWHQSVSSLMWTQEGHELESHVTVSLFPHRRHRPLNRASESPGTQGCAVCLLLTPTQRVFSLSFSVTNIDKSLRFATACQWVKWKMRHSVCPQRYTWVGVERQEHRQRSYGCGVGAECCGYSGEGGAEPVWDSGSGSEGGVPEIGLQAWVSIFKKKREQRRKERRRAIPVRERPRRQRHGGVRKPAECLGLQGMQGGEEESEEADGRREYIPHRGSTVGWENGILSQDKENQQWDFKQQNDMVWFVFQKKKKSIFPKP